MPRELDGLVLMGGSDVSPESYGESAAQARLGRATASATATRSALLHAFVAAGKPVLGVCRGLQVINVAFGGTLYQDLGAQLRRRARSPRLGALRPELSCHLDRGEHSGLARLYPGLTVTKTNSVHHQAVKDLGRDLVVEAWSEPDRVVEALRWRGPSYVFGVQWHPDFTTAAIGSFIDDAVLLDDFLAGARALTPEGA